ncbi:MAG: helix-turn-helix domain-containing protein [Clostridium sp.]|nr:helix-turn-helix domain-containing protein [Clostridium sp.]
MSILSNNLKQFRKSANLTQQQISDILGIKRSAYAYYEIDKSTPKLEIISKIAAIYNISIDELLGNTDITNDGADLRSGELRYDEEKANDRLNQLNDFEQFLVLKARMMTIEEREGLRDYLNNK